MSYKQLVNWIKFSTDVGRHINEYVVPQYGDEPDDLVSGYTVEECATRL